MRLVNEYYRLLGLGSLCSSIGHIEDGLFKLSNDWWRISDVNASYNMCPTYPFALLVPKAIRCERSIFFFGFSYLKNIMNHDTLPLVLLISEIKIC